MSTSTIAADAASTTTTEPSTALATSPEPPAPAPAAAPWPDDWREQVTEGDARALKTVNRFTDPAALWKAYRELRERFDSGRLVKLPDGSASPEDRAELNRAMGVPDKPEDYFDLIELPDGDILGEADRPIAEDFARAVHGAGATPEVVSAAFAWYLDTQEKQQAALDETDEKDRVEGQAAIRAAWGAREQRMIGSLASLFADAPGGADPEGDGLFARLMGGRMGDGKLIGNDPQVLIFLAGLANRLHPRATVTAGTAQAGADILSRMKEIEAMMRTNDPAYWKDDAVQQEYRELIEARGRAS